MGVFDSKDNKVIVKKSLSAIVNLLKHDDNVFVVVDADECGLLIYIPIRVYRVPFHLVVEEDVVFVPIDFIILEFNGILELPEVTIGHGNVIFHE